MSDQVIVHKGRTNKVTVNLGINVASDVFTSEIRAEPDQKSAIIATWAVAFATDGTDGRLTLTLDDLVTGQITVNSGYMDVKRVTGGEPVPVFDEPLEVDFRGTVTV